MSVFSSHIEIKDLSQLKEMASKLRDKNKRENYVMVPEIKALLPGPSQKRNFGWVVVEPPNRLRNLRIENFSQIYLISHTAGSAPCRAEQRLTCSGRKTAQYSCQPTPPPVSFSTECYGRASEGFP